MEPALALAPLRFRRLTRDLMLPRHKRSALFAVSAGSLALTLIGALVLGGTDTTTAAAPVSNGSDWGPEGTLLTDSPKTVRWDNEGNALESDVPRDTTQTLLHTAGKNYDDVDPAVRAAYGNLLGTDNGLGGFEMTVGQTAGLVNQTILLSFSGLPTSIDTAEQPRLQVMQCWGAPGPDGSPDPKATSPDPATCLQGARARDIASAPEADEVRSIDGDPLVVGGDWDQTVEGSVPDAPFRTVEGESYRSTFPRIEQFENPFFSRSTTNELTNVRPTQDGSGSFPFEVQSAVEQPSLGCGLRPDVSSVERCWIVVVPRLPDSLAGTTGLLGPLSPSVWAQRVQVPIDMQPAASFCEGSQSRELASGSELLASAMASWIPALCAQEGFALGYSVLGDEQARRQIGGSGTGIVLTSAPDETSTTLAYAPVALSGVTLAFNIDGISGTQARSMKLNARLVAKMLTQSYERSGDAISGTEIPQKAPWFVTSVRGINEDPEFLRLNPDFPVTQQFVGAPVLESIRSDAALRLWQWILSDAAGSAFLAGCPDADGMVINPFYSTRTYAGCESQRVQLEAAAEAKRDATTSPSTFVSTPAGYPPSGGTFPQLGWYQRDALERNGEVLQLPLTFSDIHPRVDSMATAGRRAFRSETGGNTTWCAANTDPTCVPAPGKWKANTDPTPIGARAVIAITDTATAARFQLPTAELCDVDGENCVGATQSSLQAAANAFEDTPVDGVQRAATETDYAAGEYPLTLPVYAATNTATLTAEKLAAFRTAVTFMTTTGQTVGFGSGELPPGVAPLTSKLANDATLVLARLSPISPVGAVVPPPAAPAPPAATPPTRTVPRAASTPAPAVPVPTPVAAPSIEPVAQVGITGPTEIGFPQFGLVFGLLAAAVSGLAAPIVGRERRRRV